MAQAKKNKGKPKAKAAAETTSLFSTNRYGVVQHDDGNPSTPDAFMAENPTDEEMYFNPEDDAIEVSFFDLLALYPVALNPIVARWGSPDALQTGSRTKFTHPHLNTFILTMTSLPCGLSPPHLFHCGASRYSLAVRCKRIASHSHLNPLIVDGFLPLFLLSCHFTSSS